MGNLETQGGISVTVSEAGKNTRKEVRPKRLNIRVDSSLTIGSGHVSRMIPLAMEACKRGISVRVIARELSAESQALLLSKGVPWLMLPPIDFLGLPIFGKSQFRTPSVMFLDAIQTAQVADQKFYEILVSDHYEITDDWFLKVQKSYDVCAAVVDGYAPDLSLEAIFELEVWPLGGDAYFSKIETATSLPKRYWGNPYFLFNPDIQGVEPRAGLQRMGRGPLTIAVFIGLSDVETLIVKLLTALTNLQAQLDLNVRLYTHPDLARKLKGWHESNVEVFGNTEPAAFFQECLEADFVLGSPGVSSIERTKLGIPQLLFSVADNQLRLGERLSELGVATYAGDLRTLSPEEVESNILNFTQDSLATFDPRFGQQMFDFYGPNRILQVLVPADEMSYSVRAANPSDGPTLFLWANDIARRQNSLESGPVLPREHLRWLKEQLGTGSKASIYVFLCNQQPAGQIQFHQTEVLGEFEIGYSLDTVFRGRGLAKRAIELAILEHSVSTHVTRYVATVRATNSSSIRALISVGFGDETVLEQGLLRLVLVISKECGF
jgi:spore coat polysaccharide biosynthesis predicted glycosyltransferase SpsG/RimJ/RimL family protein N-acetyltransferase